MCDCYEQRCKECGEMIPVHIADFNTPQSNIVVFCQNHLPSRNCFIHTIVEGKRDREDFKKGTKFGFRVKDWRKVPLSYCNEDCVSPNIAQETHIEKI